MRVPRRRRPRRGCQVEALDAEIAALEAEAAAGERRAGLAAREESVRATSAAGQWLEEAHQSLLARAGGHLTPGERERAVETVEGRLRADLAGREESLMATSTGSTSLTEEYGEAVASAAAAQSFAKRESVLERVAQRVDEELGARALPVGPAGPAASVGGGTGPGGRCCGGAADLSRARVDGRRGRNSGWGRSSTGARNGSSRPRATTGCWPRRPKSWRSAARSPATAASRSGRESSTRRRTCSRESTPGSSSRKAIC